MEELFEAQMVVRVTVSEVFRNCPRYVHRYQRVQESKYAPKEGSKTPLAGWKHVDLFQDILPEKDKGRAEKEGGLRTREDQIKMVKATRF